MDQTDVWLKKLKFPHPIALLLGFILVAGVLTYIVPSGAYDRVEDPNTGRNIVVSGSYQQVDHPPLSAWEIAMKVPQGLIYGADIIVLILIFGAAFYIIDKTGALKGLVTFLVNKFKHSEELILVIVGVGFAAAGAVENMQEEIIAIIPVIIVLTNRIGYNKYVAVAITLGCAMVGASFSPINPFQVLIAQKIAEVPVFSGGAFRGLFLVIAVAAWLFMVIRQARNERIPKTEEDVESKLTTNHVVILFLTLAALVTLVYGVVKLDWDFDSMSALFFILAVAAGFIGRLGITGTSQAFVEGCKEMIYASIIVGLARSILLTLEQGMIIDTIVNAMFTPLQYLPTTLSALGMMVSHFFIHFPLPSVSGQAVVTIPLLTPLSDLIGLSRQTMILSYQYGAGMSDLVIPTNGALMAVLLVAGIPFNNWIAYVRNKLLVLLVIATVSIVIASLIGL